MGQILIFDLEMVWYGNLYLTKASKDQHQHDNKADALEKV